MITNFIPVEKVKSLRVRSLLTGSATPGTDIKALPGLTAEEICEAQSNLGRTLVEQAATEYRFCQSQDI